MAPQYSTAELPVTDRDHSTSVVAAVASLLLAVAVTDSYIVHESVAFGVLRLVTSDVL